MKSQYLTLSFYVFLVILYIENVAAFTSIGSRKCSPFNTPLSSINFNLPQRGSNNFLTNKLNIQIQMSTESSNNNKKYHIVKPFKKMSDKSDKVDIFKGLSNIFSGKDWSGSEKLTKASLAKLGLNCLLAYGFVSNFSYITCFILSWVTHGRKYKLSPLAPGQWKSFLLIYSGFWAANNILRPARFSLSLLLSPAFENGVKFLKEKLRITQGKATALMVFLVNFCGTISYLLIGLTLATRLSKVPLLP